MYTCRIQVAKRKRVDSHAKPRRAQQDSLMLADGSLFETVKAGKASLQVISYIVDYFVLPVSVNCYIHFFSCVCVLITRPNLCP